MSTVEYAIAGLAAVLALYAAAVLALVVAGRRGDARALAGFVPDCLVLVHRLLREPLVPRRSKLLLVLLAAYLASPLDLVPDMVPVAGQLDDVIVLALGLRLILRSTGADLLRRHWPGPPSSLGILLRVAS